MKNKATIEAVRMLMDMSDQYCERFKHCAKLPEEDIEALDAEVIDECTALLRRSIADKVDYVAERYGIHMFEGLPEVILD